MSVIDKLLEVMRALRDEQTGCPWDIEQDFRTIAPYTIEEAYEVADAIERDDLAGLEEELGDLLLQVVFHAQMASEARAFDFMDVVEGITVKMVRRHPHVFGDESVADAKAQTVAWEHHKASERAAKGPSGLLDDIPPGFPALMRATKLGKRASRAGFDWPDAQGPLAKIREEIGELEAVMAGDVPGPAAEEEIGDLLFAVTNLARHLDVDAESALRRANHKFQRRFRHIERQLEKKGQTLKDADLTQMDALWDDAKSTE